MKNILFILIAGLTLSAQAELVHRYKFHGDVRDAEEMANGSATWDATHLEAPVFTKDIPKGRVKGGATKSIELGMNDGTKKSGFQLSSWVLRSAKGNSPSVWKQQNPRPSAGAFFRPDYTRKKSCRSCRSR